ncbi:UNVERIFIED_CONTAM: hypothetical protein HDU68_009702 [Siphonaria sp. JEL0065]|nr:hypothetical protein HDU68_009702 [Siphonaria sp. JEL0065]
MDEQVLEEDSTLWAAYSTKEMKEFKDDKISLNHFLTARSNAYSTISHLEAQMSWWTTRRRVLAFIAVVVTFVTCLGLGLGLHRSFGVSATNGDSRNSSGVSVGDGSDSGTSGGSRTNNQGMNDGIVLTTGSTFSTASKSISSASSASDFPLHGIIWNSVAWMKTSTTLPTTSTIGSATSTTTATTTTTTYSSSSQDAPSPSPSPVEILPVPSPTTSNDNNNGNNDGGNSNNGGGSGASNGGGGGGGYGSGNVANIISHDTFNAAVLACGCSTLGDTLYDGITSSFGVPLMGLGELALLLGNMAWESGGFTQTTENGCEDGHCQGGSMYYGRGFIQLTWLDNYQAVADALGRPDIVSNPSIVANNVGVNWAVTGWYWRNRVQPVLQSSGYTIGASTYAINGGIECGGGKIWEGRIKAIQCFEGQFGVAKYSALWSEDSEDKQREKFEDDKADDNEDFDNTKISSNLFLTAHGISSSSASSTNSQMESRRLWWTTRKLVLVLVALVVISATCLGLGLGLNPSFGGFAVSGSSSGTSVGEGSDPSNSGGGVNKQGTNDEANMTISSASESAYLGSQTATTATVSGASANSTIATQSAASSSGPSPIVDNNNNGGGVGGSGNVANIISRAAFNAAISSCECSTLNDTLYTGITSSLGVPLTGLSELALLLGNMAWESGGFTQTTEIGCGGWDTHCQGGDTYYGRGFIQLTWYENYKAAAEALGRPDIVSNPSIVADNVGMNWAVTGWYWSNRVQPVLRANGYTIGASTYAINGNIECGWEKKIWEGRIKAIQCFERQFGVSVDWNTSC